MIVVVVVVVVVAVVVVPFANVLAFLPRKSFEKEVVDY